MKVKNWEIFDTEEENNSILMEKFMKESGKVIKDMDTASSQTKMIKFIMEIGSTINTMAKED
jgi:hypothetical protein